MSYTLTPSSSIGSSTLPSLTPVSTSSPDSQSPQSSFSQTSQRPRYARRRNVAAFVAHSDDEEEVDSQSPSQPRQQHSSDAQYKPRLLPSPAEQVASRNLSSILPMAHRQPLQDQQRVVGRVTPSRLGRTCSLPEEYPEPSKHLEEGSGSLPTRLSGLKRTLESDSGDEGGQADDEGSQNETGGVREPSTIDAQTATNALQFHSASHHTRLPSPDNSETAAIEDDDVSTMEGNVDLDMESGEETGGFADELWDDFWAADELLEVDEPIDPFATHVGVERNGLDLPDPVDEEAEDEGAVLARLMEQAERMQRGLDPINTSVPDIALDADAESVAKDEEDGMLLVDLEEDFEDLLHVAGGGEGSRRDRALAFLESLPLKLLSQLNTSLIMLNEYERNRLNPKRTTKAKRQSTGGIEEEEPGMMLEENEGGDGVDGIPSKGKNKGKAGESGGIDWAHVGIELDLINRKTGANQVVSFPDDTLGMGNKGSAQRRFAEIMRAASLMYEAILTDTVTTKRDIFYKDVALFRTQATVDKLVDDIAASAGLKRQDFMVCATSKGLIASSALKVYLKTGEELSFSATNASLIPPIEKIEHIASDTEDIDWVLIVEKDAVFQTLCGNILLSDPDLGSGVIITGKGYPDLATLQLVSLIATTFPSAHFHALVDADPHGLDILSVYTLGSQATKFSHDHADLALGERLEWMGVKASEFNSLGVRHDDLLPLSDKDVQKAMAMLTNRPHMPDSWRHELVHMLHLNKKAEIQVLAMRGSSQLGHEGSGRDGGIDQIDQDMEDMGTGAKKGGNGVVSYVMGKLLGV